MVNEMNVTGLMTFEEFEQLPEAPEKQELLDGELIKFPPAKNTHMRVAKRVYELLQRAVDKDRVWFESGYRVGGGWLIPDLSVSWPDQRVENDYMMGAPMIAVEIGSRGNTDDQLHRKVASYLEYGADEVWVIQPKSHSMTVYTKSSSGEIVSVRTTGTYHCRTLGLNVSVPEILVG